MPGFHCASMPGCRDFSAPLENCWREAVSFAQRLRAATRFSSVSPSTSFNDGLSRTAFSMVTSIALTKAMVPPSCDNPCRTESLESFVTSRADGHECGSGTWIPSGAVGSIPMTCPIADGGDRQQRVALGQSRSGHERPYGPWQQTAAFDPVPTPIVLAGSTRVPD